MKKFKLFLRGVIIFVAIVVCFGIGVNARGIDTQTLIAQLQTQIAQLQAQLQAMLSQQQGSLQWCYDFNNNLGIASSGSPAVTDLHTALKKENISYSPDGAQVYSSGTSLAVKQFQIKYGITPHSGYVGPLTRAKLNSLYRCPDSSAGTQESLTGSLVLSKSSAYGNQSVSIPQSKLKLADFTLKNDTTEQVSLKTIEADIKLGSAYNSDIINLYLVYGDNTSSTKYVAEYINQWAVDYLLPVGQTINISLYGDIKASAPIGSTIDTNLMVSGIATNSKTNLSTNSNVALSGQRITLGLESLTVGLGSGSPVVKIIAAGQRVDVGEFRFTSLSDSYNISELKFSVPGSFFSPPITGAIIYDSTTKEVLTEKAVVMTYLNNGYFLYFTGLNIPVAINSSKSIIISYDLAATVSTGNTNKNIAPTLIYVKASDGRGNIKDGVAANSYGAASRYGGVTLPDAGVVANNMYAFKSIPTFSLISVSSSASSGANADLYKFGINAGINGDVAIKQIRFAVTISDANKNFPYLKNFSLFKDGVNYTNHIIVGKVANNNYIPLTCCNSATGIGIGTNTIVVTFNAEEIIPAGATNTYTLKADINNFYVGDNGSASISTYIPADTDQSISGSYLRAVFTPIYGLSMTPASSDINNSYNLLWSDKSATSFFQHSYANGFSTSDWYDGFGVPGLPLAGRTITAQ